MIKQTKVQRWIPSLIAAAAVAGSAGLCQAQSTIQLAPSAYIDEGTIGTEVYTVNPTGGPTGGPCLNITFDGTTTTGIQVGWNPPPFNTSGYIQIEFDFQVAASSGTAGNSGSGGSGYIAAFIQEGAPSYSWYGFGYPTIYPPADNSWVHYAFVIPAANLGETIDNVGFQWGTGSPPFSGPMTGNLANLQVTALPNPWVFEDFSAPVQGITPDTSEDAPFYSPVTGAGPTYFTPPGSWEITIADPGGYNGWNQYGGSPGLTLNFTRYEYVGFDVYLDGTSGTTYGGFQMLLFNSGWAVDQNVGAVNFNASMVGKWTHFNFPSAATGNNDCPAFVFQGTPGSDGGTDTTTFHIDNVVFWNPEVIPSLTGLTPGTPAGVQMSLDTDSTNNPNDQEGICSPSVDNDQTNFFWINQYPASYSMSFTNFPAPAAAPSFDAHIYIWNGDSLTADGQSFGYNETYSGVNWNVGDMISLDVLNGTNGGVVAQFGWKTNLFNGAIPSNNITTFTFPSMANANGTWTLNFTDNTHGNITAPDQSVNSFTVPDFYDDPHYSANFTPALTSAVSFGVYKNGNVVNNGKSAIFTHVGVSNTSGGNPLVNYNESFPGPGLTGDIAWQIATYYLDAADRVLWMPQGTGWWVHWNSTAPGWSVQSAPDLTTWGSAGVTYTYVDNTGTNTVGAVPAAGLPNIDFFRLMHP